VADMEGFVGVVDSNVVYADDSNIWETGDIW
jgi:hypothetical protein